MPRRLDTRKDTFTRQLTIISTVDPYIKPESIGQLWYNKTTNKLWVAINGLINGWRLTPTAISNLGTVSNIPTGFNVGESVKARTSFDESTRTFTIEPDTPTYSAYNITIQGNQYTKTSAHSVVWDNTTGEKYFYFDENGALQYESDSSKFMMIIANYAICGFLYWNATDSKVYLFADNERHSAEFPPITHAYLHSFLGARYANGLGLANFDHGNTSDDTGWQYTVAAGRIYDEDIGLSSSAVGLSDTIPVWSRNASGEWKLDTTADRVKVDSTTGRIAYNENGTTQTTVPNNDYMIMLLIRTNDRDYPISAIQGQTFYTNINDLRQNAANEINNLISEGLPTEEFIFVGAIAYLTNDAYTNSTKSATIEIETGVDFIDYRTSKAEGTKTGINDHGGLSGLADDDHTQYALLDGRSGDVLKIDSIQEQSVGNGVSVDGVALKDGGGTFSNPISVDTISEKTAGNGVSIDGVKLKDGGGTFSNPISTDTISEKTSGNGVSIDGVKLKDGGATLPFQSHFQMGHSAFTLTSTSFAVLKTVTGYTSELFDIQNEATPADGSFDPDANGVSIFRVDIEVPNTATAYNLLIRVINATSGNLIQEIRRIDAGIGAQRFNMTGELEYEVGEKCYVFLGKTLATNIDYYVSFSGVKVK